MTKCFEKNASAKFHVKNLIGAQSALIASQSVKAIRRPQFFILNDKEEAAYFLNDLETLLQKKVLFYPSSYRRPYQLEETDNANILLRTEVLNSLNHNNLPIIVSYPEAIFEKVISQEQLKNNSLDIQTNDSISIDFLNDCLQEYHFEMVDFVIEPGQYSIRGGIVDIFSFSNELPYRIEFFDEEVESIRTFDINSQRSKEKQKKISIVPRFPVFSDNSQESILEFLPKNSKIWIIDTEATQAKLNDFFEKANTHFQSIKENTIKHIEPEKLFLDGDNFIRQLHGFGVVEFGNQFFFKADDSYEFRSSPQPVFNKQFDLLIDDLEDSHTKGYSNFILCSGKEQINRFDSIIKDFEKEVHFTPILLSLSKGFIDHQEKICFYTDHQIFERYHKFHLKTSFANNNAITLQQLSNLQPGDYVTHIDHGIGKFAGLHTIDINNKKQEAIKLIYKDNDTLFISIHSLHKIAKYSGKDGAEPKTNKLGSGAWQKTKAKTKSRVKTIAYDLIQLYAKRKEQKGFEFSPDSFLQHELEASFMFEDTPDQFKATQDIKKDMEHSMPMDRLICGDVGFGKTEVAIRAAFKAVADNKQVAVLVPTTILAMQHAKTFKKRLKGLPCKVDYINRFRTAKELRETLKATANGEVDILIGTHRIVGKDVSFSDLGLLIIDEEQKFGVGVKDKLKTFKANVDTLTLTATPIPRTLQFSLMGARDLSVINTPPPNRYPVETEICTFDEESIRDAISYEISRGGQVYFVHNRIENIKEVAGLIQRLCPDAKIGIGHGQMDGKKLESLMISFMENEFDILVSTTIIENGLDIPNANTIIINNANNFGLSDLHQMRGRVGRSNKKSFCYLISPPNYSLTADARKRLNALEQFSELGSGFNIAMRDLDIRGAGDLLGAEQSGFISDIGFEMYQKILDEAISELKEEEFKELYADENDNDFFVDDCQLDTDMEILIPNNYVNSISERLNLYNELGSFETEEDLVEFEAKLSDRFGPIPAEVNELIKSVKLRWLAKQIGFQRLSLKNTNMTGYFPPQDSPYFQSSQFGKILDYLKNNHQNCEMKELKGKLIFRVKNVHSIQDAILSCEKLK
ncbi:transcription-repair coupling factor [bacterium]|nr:transcription-repair coupling factor [bacterium]